MSLLSFGFKKIPAPSSDRRDADGQSKKFGNQGTKASSSAGGKLMKSTKNSGNGRDGSLNSELKRKALVVDGELSDEMEYSEDFLSSKRNKDKPVASKGWSGFFPSGNKPSSDKKRSSTVDTKFSTSSLDAYRSSTPPASKILKTAYKSSGKSRDSESYSASNSSQFGSTTPIPTPPTSRRQSGSSRFKTNSPIPFSTGSPDRSESTGEKMGVMCTGDHEHNYLEWLSAGSHKDMNQLGASHPEYDHRTLFVPQGYIDGNSRFHATGFRARKITPAMRLWWAFKKEYYDTVLFFKVGKFYEIYHMDADIGTKHCGLTYMRGEVAHCGFPEKAYGKFSEILITLGYRVGRIEQTETPEQQKKRTMKSSGPVRRELCSVVSAGTRTLDVRDGHHVERDVNAAIQLICLFEGDRSNGNVEFGVCVLDCSTGKFNLGRFEDNLKNLSRLRTFLSRENPAELGFFDGNLSDEVMSFLRQAYPHTPGIQNSTVHSIIPRRERKLSCFRMEASEFLLELTSPSKRYFSQSPSLFDFFVDEAGALKPLWCSTMCALRACVKILKRSLIERRLLTMGNFALYQLPGNEQTTAFSAAPDETSAVRMVLDREAMTNLDILAANGSRMPTDGSLFGYLDHCSTKFGQRELKKWLSAPLQQAEEIRCRLRKVSALVDMVNGSHVVSNLRTLMKSMPDMERMLLRVHSAALKDENHPDARAVLCESLAFNKGKIQQLVSTLKGARIALQIMQNLKDNVTSSAHHPVKHGDDMASLRYFFDDIPFEDWHKILQDFSRSYDLDKAKQDGAVAPVPGADLEFDAAKKKVDFHIGSFDIELDELKNYFSGVPGGNSVKFFCPATGKDLYQLEVPETVLRHKELPKSQYKLKTKSKTVRRFHTDSIVKKLAALAVAQSDFEDAKADATRKVFEAFDRNRAVWSLLMEKVKELDCLISLAIVSANSTEESPMCLPEIVDGDLPVLELVEARHPCVAKILEHQGKSYIPNDLSIGGLGKASCLLLTGPNMGGKSSICRQTAVAIIMAQIGCFVNAKRARFSPVDRIFTRLGATDFIMSGQSTFFVELDETATILNNATSKSLVILDELGRGTSTYDGAAIAYATVEELLKIGSRTMFATHYHALVKDFEKCNQVATFHMAFAATERDSDSTDGKSNNCDITFLYKLVNGASDKSHGLNVARLAKLPESVIATARTKSQHFENDFLVQKLSSEIRGAVEQEASKEVLLSLWKRARHLYA